MLYFSIHQQMEYLVRFKNRQLTLRYLSREKSQVSLPGHNQDNKNQRYQLLVDRVRRVHAYNHTFFPYFVAQADGPPFPNFQSKSLCIRHGCFTSFLSASCKACSWIVNKQHIQPIIHFCFLGFYKDVIICRELAQYWLEDQINICMRHYCGIFILYIRKHSHSKQEKYMLETIGLIFLLSWDNFPKPTRSTSKTKYHTYGHMYKAKRELSVAESIYITDKLRMKADSLFCGNLVAYWSNLFKGYGWTSSKFLCSMKNCSMDPLDA